VVGQPAYHSYKERWQRVYCMMPFVSPAGTEAPDLFLTAYHQRTRQLVALFRRRR
jgi:hypothetical protein